MIYYIFKKSNISYNGTKYYEINRFNKDIYENIRGNTKKKE